MDFIGTAHETSMVNSLNLNLHMHGYAAVKSAQWRYDKIISPFNRLYLVKDGDGVIFNDEHTIRLKKGYAYLIPLNTTYSYACRTFVEKYYVHFNLEIFPGMDVFKSARACMAVKVQNTVAAELARTAQGSTIRDRLQYKANLLALIARFMATDNTIGLHNFMVADKYRSFFAYLDNHTLHDLSLKKMAEDMHVPLAGFAAGFKRDTGETLKNHIHRRLIQAAMQKLLAGKLVKEVAGELKFEDEFYFSRFFKKHANLSPKCYQKSNMMHYK